MNDEAGVMDFCNVLRLILHDALNKNSLYIISIKDKWSGSRKMTT